MFERAAEQNKSKVISDFEYNPNRIRSVTEAHLYVHELDAEKVYSNLISKNREPAEMCSLVLILALRNIVRFKKIP